jgi:4-amino-4-deoxy-L-arabinose transferase-like glycosyltransferase
MSVGAGAEPGADRGGRVVPLAGILLVALLLRLAFGLGYWVDKPLTLDEQEYLLLARSLASGQGYAYPAVIGESPDAVHFERPPVYPAVLAGVLVATGHPWTATGRGQPVEMPRSSSEIPRAVVLVQSLLGVAAVWLLAAVAGRMAGPAAAPVAALLGAIHPALVWICGYALSEALFSCLALLAAWMLLRGDESQAGPRAAWVTTAGVVVGAALLAKEAMLFFLPLGALWFLVRARARDALLLLAGVLLAVAPWVARNYVVHDRFVLTAAHGGVTFWTGNNPMARGEGDLAANPDMKRVRNAMETANRGVSPQEMDAIYYREALGFIRRHPLDWLVLQARKLFYSFVPIGPSYRLHSRLYLVASWVPYFLLLPLAVVGLARLGQQASRGWPLLLMALGTLMMNLVFFPQERFRIPVVDPALIACATAAIVGAPALRRRLSGNV